jgi:hypothetical protein
MVLEDTEAVFVNVIGNINPAELERVMDNFDVDIGGRDDADNVDDGDDDGDDDL